MGRRNSGKEKTQAEFRLIQVAVRLWISVTVMRSSRVIEAASAKAQQVIVDCARRAFHHEHGEVHTGQARAACSEGISSSLAHPYSRAGFTAMLSTMLAPRKPPSLACPRITRTGRTRWAFSPSR